MQPASAVTDGIPILPSVLRDIEPQISQHRQELAETQAEIQKKSGLIREFLSAFPNRIRNIDVTPDHQEVHAVDCATLTVSAGEYTSLLALGVNISDQNTNWFKRKFIQVMAPNADAFGTSNTAFGAIAELFMLDEGRTGKCFYDGSFQSLNRNLGTFFDLVEDAKDPDKDEVWQYISNLYELHESVTESDPQHGYTSLYSRVFNSNRTDLVAVSKKSTSTYITRRLRDKRAKENPEPTSLLGQLRFSQNISDKLILQPVMAGGEVFGPLDFKAASGKQGLHKNAQGANKFNDKSRIEFFDRLKFAFYRPHDWSPIYRIEYVEVEGGKEAKQSQFHEILAIVKYQTRIVGILELECLYLADKVSKQVAALKDVYGYSNFYFFPELFFPNRTEEI